MEATAAKLPKGSKERGMLYDITSKMQGIVSVIAPYKESEIIRAEQRDWLPTSSPFYDGNSGFVAVQRQWAINDGKTPEEARFQTEMPVAGRGGSLAKPRIPNNRHMINDKNNSQSISTQNTSDTKGVGQQKTNTSSGVYGEMVHDNKPVKSRTGDYILPVGKQELDPTRVSFSQATVSYQKRGANYNYDSIVAEMKKQNKWIGEPVDVVNMPDKAPTSIDNTRILAAREAGVKVKANVHNFNDPIPKERAQSLIYNGHVPKTWGEAIQLRVQKQNGQKGVPENWSEKFTNGSIYDVKVIKDVKTK